MLELLSDAWVQSLVEASADRSASGLSGTVALAIGKTRQAAFEIADGRVIAVGDDAEPAVTIPVTAAQLGAILEGSESLAESFIRGDVKPVGSTGPLMALVELFEDASFRQRLAVLA